VIPTGMPPGSDVGNMAILGYDPARYHTGRAPIEAAAMGIDLQPGQVYAYRAHGVARHVFLELGASLVIGVVLDGSAVGSWSSPGEGSPRQTIPTPN